MEEYYNFNDSINPISISGFWSERILVVTEDYEIKGYVFFPKTGKKNRILSDILNGKKRFIAIKDAVITHRKSPEMRTEIQEFIQLNLDTIVLMRPATKEE